VDEIHHGSGHAEGSVDFIHPTKIAALTAKADFVDASRWLG